MRSYQAWLAPAALVAAAFSSLLPLGALAQDFPSRPIRFVMSSGPGGLNDTLGRLMEAPMREALGQPMIVDNRPGAFGLIAQRAVQTAPADGYTLLMTAGEITMMPYVAKSFASFDVVRDMSPVAHVASTWGVIMTHPKSPYKTLGEFISYAKANPGRIRYGVSSAAFTLRIPVELLQTTAGIKLEVVNYKATSQAIQDMLGQQIEMIPLAITLATSLRKDLNIIAQTGPGKIRHPLIADVPTTAELGFPDISLDIWVGFMAPPKTPEPIRARLAAAVDHALKNPAVRERFVNLGMDIKFMPPPAFGEYLAADQKRWRETLPKWGIVLED